MPRSAGIVVEFAEWPAAGPQDRDQYAQLDCIDPDAQHLRAEQGGARPYRAIVRLPCPHRHAPALRQTRKRLIVDGIAGPSADVMVGGGQGFEETANILFQPK